MPNQLLNQSLNQSSDQASNPHQTLIKILAERFYAAVQKAFPDADIKFNQIELTQSTDPKFGHYQCNSAMKLVGVLKQKPREIAENILKNLDLNQQNNLKMLSKVEIAGPGFINIIFDENFLASRVPLALNFSDENLKNQKIVIDFSSPNIAKEMHVGHLRSTIIGDCLARAFEFLGYEVLRLNHVGDWGTAFGMLIAYMKSHAADVLAGKANTDLIQLMQWYRESKKYFDENPEFKKQAQLEVVALQAGDQTSLQAWKIICEISRRAYQEIYDLLGVKITERGESFYNPFLPEILLDLEQKKLIQDSDGAKCIFVEGFFNREGEPLPLMIQKSDGGYNYATTDMAAMRHRVSVEKASRIIIVTDAGQASHFGMILKASEQAGYINLNQTGFNHVPFGLVLGPDGKKFKTRSGETERLIDLILAAIAEAKKILVEREVDLTAEALDQTARILGVNAIKYSDLSGNRVGDYVFSYERMLKFEGNTAAFLMYSYVRINGIKRKIGVTPEDLKKLTQDGVKICLNHPSEIALGLHLDQFSEAVNQLTQDLSPHRLAEYLYHLADKFNAFFRDCRVEGDPAQNSRLLLCEVTAQVLKKGMEILGLQVIDRM
jgi:arginyl-tRNA synthetase